MSPIEMSKEVLAAINYSHNLESYATPELRAMFHDWLTEIEQLVKDFIAEKKRVDPREVASHFSLELQSVIYILGKLTKEGSINMQVENHPHKIRLLSKNK